jgi:phenylacetate-CoA ligase
LAKNSVNKYLTSFLQLNGELLNNVVTEVPLYRERMDFFDESLDHFKIFSALPLTEKKDILSNFPFNFFDPNRVNLSQLLNSGDVEMVESSGTSEDRIQVIRPKSFHRYWRDLTGKGHRIYQEGKNLREAILTTLNCSRTQCNLANLTFQERQIGGRLLLNRSKNPSLWTADEYKRILEELEEYRPHILTAHPVYLMYLDRWCEAEGFQRPRAEAVFLSYDYATISHIRAARKWSKTDVFIAYGLTEAFTVAMSCEEGTLHCIPDKCYMEIVWNGKNVEAAEMGEIVITSLRNEYMPFLRYRTGDLAVTASSGNTCSCGRDGMTIVSLEGRLSEVTISRKKEIITVGKLDRTLSKIYGIDLYQVEQHNTGEISISLVTNEKYNKDKEEELRYLIEELYDTNSVSISQVRHLKPTKTGKYCIVIRTCHQDLCELLDLSVKR